MDPPLHIGVAVLSLAKLRMLHSNYNFIDKYIDISDFELLEMDTDSNYFSFSEDGIEKHIKQEMKEEYDKDKYIVDQIWQKKKLKYRAKESKKMVIMKLIKKLQCII